MPDKIEKIIDSVIKEICDEDKQIAYVFTAVANAIQERIGEEIIIIPAEISGTDKKSGAQVTSVGFEELSPKDNLIGKYFVRHFLTYDLIPLHIENRSHILLERTINVAHELGHLILEKEPGRLPRRPSVTKESYEKVIELEANWMAICLLQMYGYIFPNSNPHKS